MKLAFREMHDLLIWKLGSGSATNPLSGHPSQAPVPTPPAGHEYPPVLRPQRSPRPVVGLRGPESGQSNKRHRPR